MSTKQIFQGGIPKALINFTLNYLSRASLGVNISSNSPGSVGRRPFTNKAGLLKLTTICIGSLYIGGFIAHKGASYLEENEIFVPADEDDDD